MSLNRYAALAALLTLALFVAGCGRGDKTKTPEDADGSGQASGPKTPSGARDPGGGIPDNGPGKRPSTNGSSGTPGAATVKPEPQWKPAIECPPELPKQLAGLISDDDDKRKAAGIYFENHGVDATEWCVAYASCPEDAVRRGAIYALTAPTRLDPRQARMAEIFVKGLSDPDEKIRTLSIGAFHRLGLIRVSQSLDQLLSMLDPETETAKNRIKVLNLLGSECPDSDIVIPPVVDVISNDPEVSVRVAAMRCVRKASGRIADPALLNVWAKVLTSDADPNARRQAIVQLGTYPASQLETVKESLRHASADPDERVSARAKALLSELKKDG